MLLTDTSHFCYTFPIVPAAGCTAPMYGWRMIFYFFCFGFIAERLITVPTRERPGEHTERLSLDNILLHCILKAQNPAAHAFLI